MYCTTWSGEKVTLGGFGGSVLVMGEWSVDTIHWIVDAMNFHKIYCFYCVKPHKVKKWPNCVGSGWVCRVFVGLCW